ncbi:hypothetical protein AtEden1_Chr5g0097761 [Arabidopsis thaliana]
MESCLSGQSVDMFPVSWFVVQCRKIAHEVGRLFKWCQSELSWKNDHNSQTITSNRDPLFLWLRVTVADYSRKYRNFPSCFVAPLAIRIHDDESKGYFVLLQNF